MPAMPLRARFVQGQSRPVPRTGSSATPHRRIHTSTHQRGAFGSANQASKPSAPMRGFGPGTSVSSFSSAPK
jgi:hypothetical protein